MGWLLGSGPGVNCGLVDGANESDDPLVQGAALYGEKSHAGTQGDRDGSQRIFEEARQRGGVDHDTDDDAACQLKELEQGHVADEPKLVGSDVLGDGVLLDGHEFQ